MKKSLLLFFLFASLALQATHNRAGEITYRWINGLTYEVTITTYTRACQLCADRCELTIQWGDGSGDTLPRSNGPSIVCANANDGVIIDPINQIRKNIYVGVHTYDAPGIYTIVMEDRNRNAGISNILNSDQVPFYIETELFISPSLGTNSSPIFTNAPVERGCVGKRFEHNGGAFDPDGDSLAYRLVFSRAQNGDPIQTIYDPQYVQDSVQIDPNTGLLYWDVPQNVGQFNFAFEVIEYRKNSQGRYVKIGYVTRDLQVDIEDCGNNPPQVNPVGPFCVEAGSSLNFPVTATDVDGDDLTLEAFGGPFAVQTPTATFPTVDGPEPLTGFFNWNTRCFHVRKQPYQVSFKATDMPPDPNDISLSDIYTTEILVIAPSPKNPTATPEGFDLRLNWDRSPCGQAEGYLLYRRESEYGFVPGACETGVPAYTGYEFLDSLESVNTITYLDSNDIEIGKQYCYMVVAYFEDEAQSYASEEFCASLPLNLPMFTKVDVAATDPANGIIEVEWIEAPEFDSTLYPPPYRLELWGKAENEGSFIQLSSVNNLDAGSFSHNGLNTELNRHEYRLDIYAGPNLDFVGSTPIASSVYNIASGSDQSVDLEFDFDTPWQNQRFVIYRESPTGSGNFDSIGQSFVPNYTDTGRINGEEYCYYAEAFGRYTASDSLPAPLINRSQIACAVARDTTAPCVPQFALSNVCPDTIYFSWKLGQGANCSDDVSRINIYFRTGEDDFGNTPFLSIPTTGDSTIRIVSDASIFGCYAITAVDDADQDPGGVANESLLSEEMCIESCFAIRFPNVFTPNGDAINERFLPIEIEQVASLEIEIYSRWGNLVYRSNNLEDFAVNGWDGTVENTGGLAPDGVYYYVCRFTAESIGPASEQTASGFVHLIR